MARLVSLHNHVHQQFKIDTGKIEKNASGLNMIPVVPSEFLKLAMQYPIAFTKNRETGRFVCVAMFGFNQEENLFWENNTWDALYIPLQITRQPFFIGTDDTATNDNNRFIICIDEEHESIGTSGELLFDSEGKATDYLEKAKSILTELMAGEKEVQSFIGALIELKLLQPMHLDITFANGESSRIEGMYTINEERLNELQEHDIFQLQSRGYLKLIYIIITSIGHIYSLVNKKNIRQGKNP